MLYEMRKSDHLTDVTLVCDDKQQFKAHKIVLSACSSVFKSIINDLPQNSSVIYLRGIQHQEMESVLEFMYLGVATFYQERMNEFLNVAKSLEVKEISREVEFDDEDVGSEELGESNTSNDMISDLPSAAEKIINDTNSEKIITQNVEGMFICDQCQNQFTTKGSLKMHIQAKHDGIKYACSQCEYQTSYQSDLNKHFRSKHEGFKYSCNQCEYQATQQGNLKLHIRSQHVGIKYACSQCEYQATQQSHLNRHFRSKHEGFN